MSARDIADEIVREALDGVGDSGIRIGLISEIGISSDFTPDEEKSLRGAAAAKHRPAADGASSAGSVATGCSTSSLGRGRRPRPTPSSAT